MSDTLGSIRIVDMPDLGAVDDTSSVVGEKAGSGRFSAPALRTYCLAGIAAGDITANSFASMSGMFYAGNNPSSTNFISYNSSTGDWNIVHNGVGNFYVSHDGSAGSLGPFHAHGQFDVTGPVTVSLGMYNTTTAFGGGFWVTEANHIWFGATDPSGTELTGWGYLGGSNITFTSTSAALYVAGNQPMCSGDGANFYVPNLAWKPGGGSWSATSDARIKDVLGDYTSGLEVVMRLRPVRYTYRDNWHFGTAGTADPKLTGQEFVGLVAQQVEHVMPELVSRTIGTIDGKQVDDLRTIDSTPLIYALLNSVQELAARVAALEAEKA